MAQDMVALPHARIAYFSMEIALRPEMHTYAGGLGVLAGDSARACADLGLPLVFVTLAGREGYLRQELDEAGVQIDLADPWRPEEWATPLDVLTAVRIEGRRVWVGAWLHLLEGASGRSVPVLLLDTAFEQNAPEDRTLTDRLYGGDEAHRLKQEAVLGLGGAQLLRALGFDISVYHLNEGHAALLPLWLLSHGGAAQGRPIHAGDEARVRRQCVFTTHTPVEAGHDRFGYELVEQVLGRTMVTEDLRRLGGETHLNMTQLALRLSGYVNGVAIRHAETARRMFPGHVIHAVTNGVHAPTWTHPALAALFDTIAADWRVHPENLLAADLLPDAPVRAARHQAKAELLAEISRLTGVEMRADAPLIGFARRMTAYKRPDLLFSDLERLRAIAARHPFQVIMAGKAHPRDAGGKALIEMAHRKMGELRASVPMAFLPNYDMTLASRLVSGCDIWLNTPSPPQEASGTSGMKAALNGGLNLSVLDGWWVEGCIDGVTGWSIGADGGEASGHAQALYRRLEEDVLPLYYKDPGRWTWMTKQAIAKTAPRFNSHRMMRRYAAEAYLRA